MSHDIAPGLNQGHGSILWTDLGLESVYSIMVSIREAFGCSQQNTQPIVVYTINRKDEFSSLAQTFFLEEPGSSNVRVGLIAQ